ncbi:MAG: hypothetical protein DRJ31_10635 [Candidatus Methanomethylicota archaeon]|uniref:Uncharacterized protein n=1 Tax=Thermoproteota archaeon TaxID=2056631 RepID=A0A497ELY2_9CREN|nr:MAG: hypothetical protein DRJ31_10635 [Candidatus Verstraetearchaeota archaeon]
MLRCSTTTVLDWFVSRGSAGTTWGIGEVKCEWTYFPKELLVLLEKYGGTKRAKRDRAVVSKYAL